MPLTVRARCGLCDQHPTIPDVPESVATSRVIDRATALVGKWSNDDSLRILVVEDDRALADTLGAALEDLGHTVRVSYSPFMAVTIAEEFVPDVAFIDLALPGMDGYELARALRHKPGLASVRLIAVTGLDGQRERSLELGFANHLAKPFRLDMVEKALADLE